jgi:hypothetical protein
MSAREVTKVKGPHPRLITGSPHHRGGLGDSFCRTDPLGHIDQVLETPRYFVNYEVSVLLLLHSRFLFISSPCDGHSRPPWIALRLNFPRSPADVPLQASSLGAPFTFHHPLRVAELKYPTITTQIAPAACEYQTLQRNSRCGAVSCRL